MPRPRKCRRVCCLPWNASFGPTGDQPAANTIVMSVDEYETIRLIDLLGLTQEECAAQMNVARTTVQGIYNDARSKLADVLVNGKSLVIRGGDYAICESREETCACGGCCKHRREIE
ncbi:MAG: DUF134 domain-containing protein [Clostridiaceae bacterium]